MSTRPARPRSRVADPAADPAPAQPAATTAPRRRTAPAKAAVTAAPARKPQTRESAANREAQLLDIACRLFGQKGYDRTSLRDIAEVAGITKAALYYHFPDKEALYDRVVIESLQRLNTFVRDRVQAGPSATAGIRAFFQATAEHVDSHRHEWMAGSSAFWAETGAHRAQALRLRDEFEGILRQCVIDGIANGEIRRVDPSLAGKFMLSCFGHVARWHSPEGRLSVEEVMAQFVDYALNGLAAEPGKA